MQTISTATGILTQDQFDAYTAAWLDVVSQPDSPALPASFQADSGDRVLYMSFPIQRVVELVSAVGVRQIKARFVLLPGEGGPQRFSVVLFAADDTQLPEGRRSAYYLAEPSWKQDAHPVVDMPVPSNLATIWLDGWKSAEAVTPALFATPDGPLEGYNFDIKDFLTPLFTDQPYLNQEIRLWLGLHAYFSPTDTDNITQTFGLVVRRFDPLQHTQQADDELYFDLSTPCPPTH